MKIIIDAMGGDFSPEEQIKGCIEATKELEFSPVLIGNREKILDCARSLRLSLEGIEIVHTENTIEMTDPPLSVRSKPDTSLKVGLQMLAGKEADAFVSAGSTGAVQTGATLFVKRIPGISRSAIGTILPMTNPMLLLDCGANTSFTSEILVEYAVMGTTYMKKVCNIKNPRVGLLNIGAEEHKGTEKHAEAYKLLSEDSGINFIGNAEPNEIPFGICDVLVADGFSGNIFLKSCEGVGKYLLSSLREAYTKNTVSKFSALLSRSTLRAVKKKFDASEYGGAPLLGIAAPVIKAHGNSNAQAIKNAIKQAYHYAAEKTVDTIGEEIAKRKKEQQL